MPRQGYLRTGPREDGPCRLRLGDMNTTGWLRPEF